MTLPQFRQLPFNTRPDLSPYLIHLTKNTRGEDNFSAFKNLVNILETGHIWGSGRSAYIKGSNKAACFMDVPFASLKYVLTPENTKRDAPRYEANGIVIGKQRGYKKGLRPVLYLSDAEADALKIPKAERWRVVRLERQLTGWINWVHEREWRCKGSFKLGKTIPAVIVRNRKQAIRLRKMIEANPKSFKCIPDAILPAKLICQGFLT